MTAYDTGRLADALLIIHGERLYRLPLAMRRLPRDVVYALEEIRADRLYLEETPTFEEFCRKNYGWGPEVSGRIETLARLFRAEDSVAGDPLPPTPRALPPKEKPRPIVYFLACDSAGLVKIGTTTTARKRINALTTSSPVPVHLLATMPGGVREERELHRRFAHLRQHGEWFTAASDLLTFIGGLGS